MEWTNKEQSEKLMNLGINPGTSDLTLKALVTDSRGTEINSPEWVMITMPFQDLVKDTGFAPDYKFSEGIAETVEWCKKEML